MPKDEWGVKRLCPHCTSRFYDLQRDPMTCPECGHSFTAESLFAGHLDADAGDDELDDDLLEDDEDDEVSLDEIADVAGGEDEG